MDIGPVLEQRVAVTPQMILANTLLHLSSTELEQTISQALAENPALELIEVLRCPRCGLPLSNGRCPSCSRAEFRAEAQTTTHLGHAASPSDEDNDPTTRLTASTTLSEHVLRQARTSLEAGDLPIATCIVENLDDHGFLGCGLDRVASLCKADLARVQAVASAIQQLDPVGVAAQDARECLLIQLDYLRQDGIEHPLAASLISEHWEAMSRQSFEEMARALATTAGEIERALIFIRDNLNPFPAHADWADVHESPPEKENTYPIPDVIIIKGTDPGSKSEYEIELPGAQLFQLRVSAAYREALKGLSPSDDIDEWSGFYDKARLFIKSVEQRWQTLWGLARQLVDYQEGFVAHGDRHLKPLTRAQVARTMKVHESTVSRAVAGKFAQLPNGRIVPLAKFFDSAAPIKEIIKELIAQESKPLSDREIAARLAQRGHPIARRTVAKYRSAMNILPSSLR
jgi:RNA polymerase sigma-54 factor